MNTSLAHLSASARAKLDAIVPIIREAAEVELIILFGSYACGDQVRLDVETGYCSDFDILVVVKSPKLADDLALWSQAEARAEALPGMTPITLIVHDFEFVRNKIEYGQYFFNDIRRRDVFPRATPEDDALFKKLKHAYVDARYSKNYSITEEELKALAARVKVLRERTEAACRERIATLG